ncbi:hypothetical protein SCP_0410800 [Sparassis crispa]|uniref:Phosphatidylinositol-specific phospholipase C X domain-containing protein n=1 Tax=Sparassis crispa TaxID=139825 RepID=A0A401GKK2_9APHY|nr:hypothetical protein SCP_0410800 [Sparassis crispa]GBE82695.1 hypothetical protein SCP_0410800 [Sparassis crispa]
MKRISLVNHTTDVLVWGSCDLVEHEILSPSVSTSISLSKFHTSVTIAVVSASANVDKEWAVPAKAFTIRLPLSLGASWKAVEVEKGCPWRIYQSRVSKKHHRLLILPRRDMSTFLAEMPDSLPLSSLLLPGTHDTMAFYGWPISQCQSLTTPLAVQLQFGIRVLDIRLAVIENRLISYHGAYPERAPFQEILATVHAFLTASTTCHETIVMSIKQEDFMKTSIVLFSQLVRDEILHGPGGRDMWFFENRIPHLGEVRGKVVLFSRFGGDGSDWEGGLEGLGIHPTAWPDSSKWGFTWQCKDTLVRTHDWYNIPSFLSIPEKTELSTQILQPDDPPFPTLSISYFSASSFPLAFPPTIAQGFGWPRFGLGVEGVNTRVGKWLLDLFGGNVRNTDKEGSAGDEVRIRGWTLMDFFKDPGDNALVPLLVECNFRGRKEGEEGWL